jgi:hypothetical protein
LALALLVSGCTTWKVEQRRAWAQQAHQRGPVPVLAGKRCVDGACRCRTAHDPGESPPPAAGKKRIEIRMSAVNGDIKLDSPSAGHFAQTGAEEACFYVDLDVNLSHDFHLDSMEVRADAGVTPHVRIAEYGPAGPYWYDLVDITCGLGSSVCTLEAAKDWGESWRTTRKRGRLEACRERV